MEDKVNYESDKPQNTMTGEVEWSHLFRPDYAYNKDGDWSLGLKTGTSEGEPILAIIRESAGLRSGAERCQDFAKPPIIENEDGSKTFKFKQSAIIRMEGKEPSHTKITVLDAKMNPWPEAVNIGKGSKVKVRYKARSWNVKLQGGVGVTLTLIAVQVIEHVPYVPSHGFEEEEGVDMGSDIPGIDTSAPDSASPGTDAANPYSDHTGGPVTDDLPF